MVRIAAQVQAKLKDDTDPEWQEYRDFYNSLINDYGIDIPDFSDESQEFDNYASVVANQIIIRKTPGFSDEKLMENINNFLNDNLIESKNVTKGEELPYRIYMNHAMEQLQVATTFLPIFFYSVTMIIIGLFMNQIIKTMTVEIGIMMSVGIDKKDIISLFVLFALIMSITAGILGLAGGFGLNSLLVSILIKTYSIPVIPYALHPLVAVLSVVLLVVFAEVATLLSCINIFRITPKDATIAKEAKLRKLPKWLNKFIDKAPMNIKLSTNAIAQNPRRFFVSAFSLFASMVLILLSCFFYVSKEEMMNQSLQRRLTYDCQVYMASKIEDTFLDDLDNQDVVEDYEDCFYTYIQFDINGKKEYLECLAVDEKDMSDLINIPNYRGTGKLTVPETGLIIPRGTADKYGVKVGDEITCKDKKVKVVDISYQYFHPLTYMSKNQMESLEVQSVSTLIVKLDHNIENYEKTFLDYLSGSGEHCLSVFTRSLGKDLHAIFNAIDIFIIIMVIFSLGMAFVILTIMSQNSLMEQKRQVSVFRAIGFTVTNISNVWTIQSVLQLIGASIIGIPAGIGFSILLFKLCSSPSQIYPFIADWRVILFALLFILLVVVVCHLISMFSIKKWNLADNLRSRE